MKTGFELDEIAYRLYLECIANSSWFSYDSKLNFIKEKDNKYKEFYVDANKYLRKEKIEKINQNEEST